MTETWGLSPTMLEGRVALVTGGARGLGRAIAEGLLGLGADVEVCGRTAPDTVPRVGSREADFVACDVRRAEAVAEMIATIEQRRGRLDIVVNNAGGSPKVDAATASPRFSEAIVALNLMAPIHVAAAAHRLLVQSPGGGLVVNIASISGTRPSPGTAAYGAAKAGLISLSRSLAMEWGPGVRVNTVVVGLVAMDGGDDHYGGTDARAQIDATLPLGRIARRRRRRRGRLSRIAACSLYQRQRDRRPRRRRTSLVPWSGWLLIVSNGKFRMIDEPVVERTNHLFQPSSPVPLSHQG